MSMTLSPSLQPSYVEHALDKRPSPDALGVPQRYLRAGDVVTGTTLPGRDAVNHGEVPSSILPMTFLRGCWPVRQTAQQGNRARLGQKLSRAPTRKSPPSRGGARAESPRVLHDLPGATRRPRCRQISPARPRISRHVIGGADGVLVIAFDHVTVLPHVPFARSARRCDEAVDCRAGGMMERLVRECKGTL